MSSSPSRGARREGSQQRGLRRVLSVSALACFALPFLTVTCHGKATVSGVQAATKIDITSNDGPGEADLVRDEPPNGFAVVALVAAVVGLASSFAPSALGPARSRSVAVWTAAVGVGALECLFVYAFFRSWGDVWLRIGWVGALMLQVMVAWAWAGMGGLPRWILVTAAVVAASMIPGAVVAIEDLSASPLLFVPLYLGGFLAVAFAVGAVRALGQPADAARSGALRMVGAGVVWFTCVAVAAVGAPFLMGLLVSPETAPESVGSSYGFALLILAITIGASIVAWAAGSTIVDGAHGSDARGSDEPAPPELGFSPATPPRRGGAS
ncbi:MAG: hypothetical protein ACRDG8_13150 [Actinomycetota bacterium]